MEGLPLGFLKAYDLSLRFFYFFLYFHFWWHAHELLISNQHKNVFVPWLIDWFGRQINREGQWRKNKKRRNRENPSPSLHTYMIQRADARSGWSQQSETILASPVDFRTPAFGSSSTHKEEAESKLELPGLELALWCQMLLLQVAA